ncbi:P-loop containing nucleoside triphosphate hydrolase protein, partial [Mycena latifolia]
DNIVTCLNDTVGTLEVVEDSLQTPFLKPISNTIQSLLTAVQIVKWNKNECLHMLEQTCKLLYGILYAHTREDTRGQLSPNLLYNLGRVTETLHKIHTIVEAQQEKSRIKQFFRQGELSTLLKHCHLGLDEGLEAFKIGGAHVLNDLSEMQQSIQRMRQEVLEMIIALSDTSSDRGSMSIGGFESSSNSLSLLPSDPQIFHGREAEISTIIQILSQEEPRIAILGAGGMGKTSLARTILHHTAITTRYEQHRVFVSCDAAANSVQLAALIGEHIGLRQGKDLTRPVIHHFRGSPPSLLILDNLEIIWEPRETRAGVEKLLSLLTDINHLALMITMRGAERPSNIQWTRPFLEPLKPLKQDAARKIFIDITDDSHSLEEVDKILLLADNMPLAINLIAHLVDHEGVSSVLDRWETEKTSLLSEGYDKGSNLDLSISLSLASSRIRALPQSQDLLSLLSILPDGLSDIELVQCLLPIENILSCKVALLSTSLAYTDDQQRLKALVPIREYMSKMHPPVTALVQPLLKYF